MLYQLWVYKRSPEPASYKTYFYGRKLSSDIYWYEQVLRRSEAPRLINYPGFSQLAGDVLWALHPFRHAYEVQQWNDPIPGLVDMVYMVIGYWGRLSGLLGHKLQLKWHSSVFMQRSLAHKL